MSSSVHVNNKKNYILILGEGPATGLDGTAVSIQKPKMYSIKPKNTKYSTNFTVSRKKFPLSLHYDGANSYLFVIGAEIHKVKAKFSEFVATPLCLGNISKDFSVDNMKKTRFYGYVYDYSLDSDSDDILVIHKYLMKNNDTV